MNPSQRILQLNRRAEWLLDQAESMLQPKKLDRFAFPYENLWERYRSKSKRLRRIQRLVRHTEIEARQRIEEMLNQ